MTAELRYRTLPLDLDTRAAADGDGVDVVASTDAVVNMPWGRERLLHGPENVNLDAIDRAPVLWNHDRGVLVGRPSRARLAGGKLRLRIDFATNGRARELAGDVAGGFVRAVSLGYSVESERATRDAQGPLIEALRWTVHEVSFVSIPADLGAGVGRAAASTPSRGNRTMTNEPETPDPIETRADAIVNLCQTHNMMEAAEGWIASDLSVPKVRELILARLRRRDLANHIPASAAQDFRANDDATGAEPYPFARAVFGQVARSGIELGGLRDLQRQLGAGWEGQHRGVLAPFRVRATLTTGGSTTGAELVPTAHGEFVDMLKARSVVLELGARVIEVGQGKLALPRKTAASTASWIEENPGTGVSASNPTLDQVVLAGKTLVARATYSMQLARQGLPMIEQILREDMAQEFAIALDKAALAGGGSNEPSGILADAAVPVVVMGTNGGVPTLLKIVELESTIDAVAGLNTRTAFVTTPGARAKMRSTAIDAGSGRFLWGDDNKTLGYLAASTSNVPANLTKGTSTTVCSAAILGNFADLVIGSWGAIDFIVDPYTDAAKQLIHITAALLVDVGVRRPKSFAVIKDLLVT